jgi:hypothetical protein
MAAVARGRLPGVDDGWWSRLRVGRRLGIAFEMLIVEMYQGLPFRLSREGALPRQRWSLCA